jgi:hypothetical protein
MLRRLQLGFDNNIVPSHARKEFTIMKRRCNAYDNNIIPSHAQRRCNAYDKIKCISRMNNIAHLRIFPGPQSSYPPM